MATPRPRRETPKQKRERQYREYVRDHPNPFVGWHDSDERGRMLEIVEHALVMSGREFLWQKDKKHNPKPLTAKELAIAYYAVQCKLKNKKNRGLNGGELNAAFRECCGKSCPPNMRRPLLKTLFDLDLIRPVKNHSTANGQGTVYELVPEGQTNRGRPYKPPARPRPAPPEPTPPSADDMADPW